MRALVIEETTGPSAGVLTEVEEPRGAHPWARDERLLVEVHAAGVSFPDLLQSRGAYQHGLPAPFVSGGEYAGVVLEAPGGSRFAPGDRVAGLTVFGAVAERTLAIPHYTLKIPPTMAWEAGASFFLNYATAWFTLERAGFTDGQSVLVHGAAGGVGTATLDLLRGRAAPSIAVVSSDAKSGVALEAGADHVLRTEEPWAKTARELTGGLGVDVVVDPVGGDRVVDSLRALDIGGRLMIVGFAAGSIPQIPANRLLLRDLTAVGVALDPWVQRFPELAERLVTDLEAWAAAGRINPVIGDALPFERATEALGIIDRREAQGKVVVRIRP